MDGIIEYLSEVTNATMWLASIGIVWLIIEIVCGMLYQKINCNNYYLKKELKDRNKIIANLLNSRNR